MTRRVRLLAAAAAALMSGALVGGGAASEDLESRQQASEVPSPIIVRPQVGIAGVRLGDPAGRVRALLGPPVRVGADTQPGPIVYRQWFYRGLKLGLVGSSGRISVLNMETSSSDAVTPRGVGVGSGQADVREDYPAARCATSQRMRTCTIGEPGSRQTGFEIRSGLVRAIWVAEVF